MALSGSGMTVNVHDCTVVGAGSTGLIAQNGIQVGFGAGGTVSNCAISNMSYTNPNVAVATGLTSRTPTDPEGWSATVSVS